MNPSQTLCSLTVDIHMYIQTPVDVLVLRVPGCADWRSGTERLEAVSVLRVRPACPATIIPTPNNQGQHCAKHIGFNLEFY